MKLHEPGENSENLIKDESWFSLQIRAAGCVKVGLNSSLRSCNRDAKEFRVLGAEAAVAASGLLTHIFRLLNVFCCVVEDLNPHAGVAKSPLVTLPSPSALSPIRRKSKTGPQVHALNFLFGLNFPLRPACLSLRSYPFPKLFSVTHPPLKNHILFKKNKEK